MSSDYARQLERERRADRKEARRLAALFPDFVGMKANRGGWVLIEFQRFTKKRQGWQSARRYLWDLAQIRGV